MRRILFYYKSCMGRYLYLSHTQEDKIWIKFGKGLRELLTDQEAREVDKEWMGEEFINQMENELGFYDPLWHRGNYAQRVTWKLSEIFKGLRKVMPDEWENIIFNSLEAVKNIDAEDLGAKGAAKHFATEGGYVPDTLNVSRKSKEEY